MYHIWGRRHVASLVAVTVQLSLSCRSHSYCGRTISEEESRIRMRQIVINSELLSTEEARKLKVHKFSNFFSDEDIQSVIDFQSAHSESLGKARRDKHGVKALNSPWVTTYLSTDHLMQRTHPALVDRLIDAALEADERQAWGILKGSREGLNIRVIELHDVEPGGALSDRLHFDGGSLVTLDVMLSSPKDFEGGAFVTPEVDGRTGESSWRHVFEQGDLIVFPSHKYHYVEPVTAGHRSVLVMELWRGENRGCAHRCLQHLGECDYSTARSRVDALLHASFPDVDPW